MPSVLGSLLRRALSARVSRTQSLGRARGSRRSEHSTQAPPDSTFSVREARAFSEVPGQRRRRKRGRSSVGRSTSKNWHRRLCVSSTGSVWCWQIRVAGCASAAEVLVGPPARDTWHSMTHPCRDTKSHPYDAPWFTGSILRRRASVGDSSGEVTHRRFQGHASSSHQYRERAQRLERRRPDRPRVPSACDRSSGRQAPLLGINLWRSCRDLIDCVVVRRVGIPRATDLGRRPGSTCLAASLFGPTDDGGGPGSAMVGDRSPLCSLPPHHSDVRPESSSAGSAAWIAAFPFDARSRYAHRLPRLDILIQH